MKLRLQVQYASRRPAPGPTRIRRWARAALADARRRETWIGIRIVNERESAALNTRYRGKGKSTNVLAFPFEPPPGAASSVLGDLVICAPVVNREAKAKGLASAAHWAHMVVHGIMHLRGYDHQSRREAAIMERKETAVLKGLGFADPYA
ncbi:MAG: rRNA maturation RNase YbeY [Gammaproteobacteria bacterium]